MKSVANTYKQMTLSSGAKAYGLLEGSFPSKPANLEFRAIGLARDGSRMAGASLYVRYPQMEWHLMTQDYVTDASPVRPCVSFKVSLRTLREQPDGIPSAIPVRDGFVPAQVKHLDTLTNEHSSRILATYPQTT